MVLKSCYTVSVIRKNQNLNLLEPIIIVGKIKDNFFEIENANNTKVCKGCPRCRPTEIGRFGEIKK